jgi:hypothetical protein
MAEQIENINYLAPTGFKVTISRENYPAMQYFAQQIQHPAIDVGATETPYKRLSSVAFIGDKITHGTLSMDLIMDENMQSYQEIYDWMHRMVNEEHTPTSARFSTLGGEVPTSYCDIRVSILTSSNNPNKEFHYKNAFPTTLGDVMFMSTSDGTYITFPVSFRFDYFEFS